MQIGSLRIANGLWKFRRALNPEHKMRRLLQLSSLIIFCIATAVSAQVRPVYVGGGVQGAFNMHQLSLPVYRGDTLCGVFENGNSILPNGFLTYEQPLGDPAESFWIAPRLHLNSLGALITTPATDNARVRSPIDSSLVASSRVHHLDASILAAGLDLFFKYPLSSRLFVVVGPSVNYLLRRDATRTEIITDPAGATFGNGSNTRTLETGQIANSASIMATGTLGASLDLPIASKVVLAPELSLTFPINSIRTDYKWKVLSVSLGAALKFNIAKEPQLQVIVQPPPPPPEKPKSEFAGTIKISGVMKDSAGNEREFARPELRVEEFARREAYPTLNYIFFDAVRSDIPARYHLLQQPEAESFDPQMLSGKSSLEVYHEALNVLGYRLKQNPKTQITITGTNSMAGTEATMPALAKQRAEAVKNYLTTIWRIDPTRIQVASVALPKNASSTTTAQGVEENRRVEITSNDPAFLDPLTIETIDRTMNPPKIRIRRTESSRYPLEGNEMVLSQGGKDLMRVTGTQAVADWTPTSDQLPRTDAPMIATLRLKDDQGATFEAADTATVQQVTIKRKREERVKDKIIERYNLITFDFDKADLDQRSKRVISEIAESVTSNDRIAIQGYTDMTGEQQHNFELSTTRAKNVEAALRSALGDRNTNITFQTEGHGMLNLVDNQLPEGRFLSRTVFVQLEKPVQ
jgi:outer membrane protein OmpA-like peptidoglycan-associated protein